MTEMRRLRRALVALYLAPGPFNEAEAARIVQALRDELERKAGEA